MKIAVNTRLLLKGKLEGIGWVAYETLRRMVSAHPEVEFYFLFDRKPDPLFLFNARVTESSKNQMNRKGCRAWGNNTTGFTLSAKRNKGSGLRSKRK